MTNDEGRTTNEPSASSVVRPSSFVASSSVAPSSIRPLAGFRALDLTDLTGQFCGKVLADLGMDVVKIEPPGGDPVRRLGPFKNDRPHLEGSLRFAYLNGGKSSLTLDYESLAGRDLLFRLVEQADVLIESWPPGTLDGLGLSAAALQARNPKLIVTSVTGFGQDGPYRDYQWTDLISFAMGGLMYISGDESLPPLKAPDTQAYYFGCLYAAFGTLLCLWQRGDDQRGRRVDVSLQETIASQEHLIRAATFDGHAIRRHGSQHEHVAPANIFPTSDGHVYVFVSQQHWKPFLALWPDHSPEMDDDAWRSNRYRRARDEWLNERVAAFTSRYSKRDFVELMQRNGIPCLPVNTPADFRRDEQVEARGIFASLEHPFLGTFEQVAFPALLNGQRLAPQPSPLLGQHTHDLLTSLLGLSSQEIELLFAQGIVLAMPGFLSGVRVISFTAGVAGPNAARVLAQCGAEVIKIESKRGGLDSFRFFSAEDDPDASPRFIEANLNVLSLTLNLKERTAIRLVRELAARSDVVLDNFRADVLPRLGLGPDDLRQARDDLIVVKMPGLGSSGPKSWYGTWGSTLTAFSGMTSLWNHPGQPRPIGSQGVLPDYVASVYTPLMVLAALLQRRRTGEGLSLDLAQVETTAYLLGQTFLESAINGREPEPVGNDWAYAAPHNCYPCAGEDRWCVIAVETDTQWSALCDAIGHSNFATDPRYNSLPRRRERLTEIDETVAAWTRERDAHDVMQSLQAVGVPCGVVQSGDDLVADPHLQARGFISGVEHPTLGRLPLAALPLHLSDGGIDPVRCSPAVGEHNEYVICDLLGYGRDQLAAWQAEGVVV